MKVCTKCKEDKPLSEFGKCKSASDGLMFWCRDCNKKQCALYRKKNPDTVREYGKKYKKDNKGVVRSCHERYRKRHKDKTHAASILSLYKKQKLAPIWLTPEDIKKMESLYIEAHRLSKETGVQYHVDHIIPLRGKNVSGLHVPSNLQILTAEENRKKSNN